MPGILVYLQGNHRIVNIIKLCAGHAPLAHSVRDIAEFEEGTVLISADTVVLEHAGNKAVSFCWLWTEQVDY